MDENFLIENTVKSSQVFINTNENVKSYNEDQLKTLQLNILNGIVEKLKNKSNYFKKRYSEINEINFASIPIMSRKDLIAFFQEDKGLKNTSDYIEFKSSGSTGSPLSFKWSYSDLSISMGLLVKSIGNINSKMAYITIPSENKFGRISAKILSNFFDIKIFSAVDSEEIIIKNLKSYNPNILISKPQILTQIAKSIGPKRHEVLRDLKELIYVGENISTEEEFIIKDKLKIQPKTSYSISEVGSIGRQVDNSKEISIYSPFVHIDIVNNKNQIIYNTYEQGRVIVTCLYDKETPIIRYDTGDLAKNIDLSLKNRKISYLEGRSTKKIEISSNDSIHYIDERVFWNINIRGIEKYQVVLIQKNKLKIFIILSISNKQALGEVIDTFNSNLKNLLGGLFNNIELHYERVEKIIPNSGGKTPQFKSLFNE